ncbi:MAG: hypothetical protein Q8Q03_02310 [bacterium]|nr:hypothetical protein [bacterium]
MTTPPAYAAAKQSKDKIIEELLARGQQEDVIKILRNKAHFEMKFDNVRKTTGIFYQRMIDIFLSDKDNRFSAAESHSNMLMQLCDVLLGAVMYDYKKKAGMT